MYTFAIQLFQFSGIVSPPFVTTGFTAFLWFAPCKSYAPGFYFLEECAERLDFSTERKMFLFRGHISKIYWATICSVIYYTLLKPMAACVYFIIQLYFVESCGIRYYLKNIYKNVLNLKTYSAKYNLIQVYKQIQIIVCYYNQIHQNIFTIVLINLIGVCIVIGLFAIITSWSFITVIQLLVLGTITIDSFIAMVICFGNFGRIYGESVKILAAFQLNIAGTRCCKSEFVLQRKLINCLMPTKIMIGSVNYFDKLTPITFLNFCFTLLVDMLLV